MNNFIYIIISIFNFVNRYLEIGSRKLLEALETVMCEGENAKSLRREDMGAVFDFSRKTELFTNNVKKTGPASFFRKAAKNEPKSGGFIGFI